MAHIHILHIYTQKSRDLDTRQQSEETIAGFSIGAYTSYTFICLYRVEGFFCYVFFFLLFTQTHISVKNAPSM